MAQLKVVYNGVGRYVCQLKRITFTYCRNGGSSRGLREFIDTHLVDIAKSNPEVMFYVKQRNGKHPRMVAEFLNGNKKDLSVKNMEPEKISKCTQDLRNELGGAEVKLRKTWHTENPSIQGTWDPFLNKPPPKLS